MSPKEKAEELLNKYSKVRIDLISGSSFISGSRFMYKEESKNCCLIAIEEIISVKPNSPNYYTDTIGYWIEVKKELENL